MSDSMEDRIKALEDALRDAQNALDKSEAKVALLMDERNAALAALPDAQTIIAGAYQAAAKAGCEALEGLMVDDMALFVAERIVPAIISAAPADAIAARDAMIADAVDAVAEHWFQGVTGKRQLLPEAQAEIRAIAAAIRKRGEG